MNSSHTESNWFTYDLFGNHVPLLPSIHFSWGVLVWAGFRRWITILDHETLFAHFDPLALFDCFCTGIADRDSISSMRGPVLYRHIAKCSRTFSW